MKQNNFSFIGFTIFFAGFFLFAACNPFLKTSGGSITVNLPNSNARLAACDLNSYTISLLDALGKEVQTATVSGGNCTFDNIAPGNYTIYVGGEYIDNSEMRYPIASGKTTAEVNAGETAEAIVVLKQTGFFVAQGLEDNDSWKNGDDESGLDYTPGASPKSPYRNLQTAIEKIAGTSSVSGINDGKSEYTIYVKGTIYPKATSDSEYQMADFLNIPADEKLNISIVGVDRITGGEHVQAVLNGKTTNNSDNYDSIIKTGSADVSLPKLNLKLMNLKISDGEASCGGGIYNNSATITITNCNISNNNTKSNTNCPGGAIYNTHGTITINNSTLSENKAATKETESATGVSDGSCGGVIFNDVEGKVYINKCEIKNNFAVNCGGVIFNNYGATLKITDSVITDNDANYNGSNSGNSGAIFNNGKQNNSTYEGGDATLVNCKITNNTSRGAGGAIDNGINASLTITNCTISGSKTMSNEYGNGGAIYNEGKISIYNSTLSDNLSGKSNYDSGYGGGGALYNKGEASIYGGTLTGNISNLYGGAIYNDGKLTIIGGTYTDNSVADNCYGGAIYNATADSKISIGGNIYITPNNTKNEIYLNGKSTLIISEPLTNITTPIARVIPSVQEVGIPVLVAETANGVNLAVESKKFTTIDGYIINTDGIMANNQ